MLSNERSHVNVYQIVNVSECLQLVPPHTATYARGAKTHNRLIGFLNSGFRKISQVF